MYPQTSISSAKLIVKDNGIIAGVELAQMIFKYLAKEINIEVLKKDGDIVHYGDIVFKVTCDTRTILKAERLILNVCRDSAV